MLRREESRLYGSRQLRGGELRLLWDAHRLGGRDSFRVETGPDSSWRGEATDDEVLDLHAHIEHRLQSTSTRGNYNKYRDVLREEVREAGRRWGFEPEPSEIDTLP
jgi:hypothetical protein